MLEKDSQDDANNNIQLKQLTEFKELLQYFKNLADNKMGYPVSLLTYLGIVDNQLLGIKPGSLANILLNNVGDPFRDSETSLMEVKKHERKLIRILEKYYGAKKDTLRGYVTTGGTEGNFAGLWWSKRYLVSCALPNLIKTDDIIKIQIKEEQDLQATLSKIPLNDYPNRAEHLQKLIDTRDAIVANRSIVQQLLTPTVFFAKDHTHYSIPKISEILHLNIKPINAKPDGSMDLNEFQKALILHIGAHPHSSIIVITNIGTTITGAIDDVPGIKKILDSLPSKPTYTIHMDGALTGFVLPIIKPFGEVADYFSALGVNTLAVSAHKYPGLSQPCGILLAYKPFFEKAFEKSERSIDYVGNILDVTVTGSRSGLNVLMFYNALYTLGLQKNTDTLKKMVTENLENAQYLYAELQKIFPPNTVTYLFQFNVSFPKPSMALAKKYQLMLRGKNATICVLSNITKDLIDRFMIDLKDDLKKESSIVEHNKDIRLSPKEDKIMITGDLEYSIQPLTVDHLKPAVDLFTKTFCESEPVTQYLGLQYNDYAPFATEVTERAIANNLGKAIINKRGKLIAVVIAEDLADPFQPNFTRYPKLKPIFGLLGELNQPFFENKQFKKGKIIHMWIAAVDPQFRSHGLYIDLGMACIEDALNKGYDFAYSEFTNATSEKIIHQFKQLQLCNKLKYEDYVLDGKQPFKGLKGGAYAYIAAIRTNVSLDSLEDCYTITQERAPH